MISQPRFSPSQACGNLFVLSGILVLCGVMLWTGRNIWYWPASGSDCYLYWERGLLVAGMVMVTLGLALLEGVLITHGDLIAARIGYVTYLIAAILGIMAESYMFDGGEPVYALVVAYVVLAFLGQAAIGLSLLITNILPAWIGWTTIVWNLGFLLLVVIFSPTDVYYPILFHIVPLVLGVALISREKAVALLDQATLTTPITN
jgi:hypothetical protein